MGTHGTDHGKHDPCCCRRGLILSSKSQKDRLEALDAVINAIAHPARRQILLTIHFRGGTMTAGEIAGRFAHTWATTTGHLRILENAHLLNQQRIGRARHYTINEERLALIGEWLGWFKKTAETAKVQEADQDFKRTRVIRKFPT